MRGIAGDYGKSTTKKEVVIPKDYLIIDTSIDDSLETKVRDELKNENYEKFKKARNKFLSEDDFTDIAAILNFNFNKSKNNKEIQEELNKQKKHLNDFISELSPDKIVTIAKFLIEKNDDVMLAKILERNHQKILQSKKQGNCYLKALELNNIYTIESLLSYDIDPRKYSDLDNNPIALCCADSDPFFLKELFKLFEKKTNLLKECLLSQDKNGDNSLIYTIQGRSFVASLKLIYDATKKTDYSSSALYDKALMLTIENSHPQSFKYLFEKFSTVHKFAAQKDKSLTQITKKILEKDDKVISKVALEVLKRTSVMLTYQLLEQLKEIEEISNSDFLANEITSICCLGNYLSLLDYIEQFKDDSNLTSYLQTCDYEGHSVLWSAIHAQGASALFIVKMLEYKADPNVENEYFNKRSPILLAAQLQKFSHLEVLLRSSQTSAESKTKFLQEICKNENQFNRNKLLFETILSSLDSTFIIEQDRETLKTIFDRIIRYNLHEEHHKLTTNIPTEIKKEAYQELMSEAIVIANFPFITSLIQNSKVNDSGFKHDIISQSGSLDSMRSCTEKSLEKRASFIDIIYDKPCNKTILDGFALDSYLDVICYQAVMENDPIEKQKFVELIELMLLNDYNFSAKNQDISIDILNLIGAKNPNECQISCAIC